MRDKMEDRIRFGSDGNGIFVVVRCRDDGRWEVYSSLTLFERDRAPWMEITDQDAAMGREWLNSDSTWQGPGFPMPKRGCVSCGRSPMPLRRDGVTPMLHNGPDGKPCPFYTPIGNDAA